MHTPQTGISTAPNGIQTTLLGNESSFWAQFQEVGEQTAVKWVGVNTNGCEWCLDIDSYVCLQGSKAVLELLSVYTEHL